MSDNSFDQETIAQVLDAHNADSVDELPAPVRNNIREGPNADINPFEGWR